LGPRGRRFKSCRPDFRSQLSTLNHQRSTRILGCLRASATPGRSRNWRSTPQGGIILSPRPVDFFAGRDRPGRVILMSLFISKLYIPRLHGLFAWHGQGRTRPDKFCESCESLTRQPVMKDGRSVTLSQMANNPASVYVFVVRRRSLCRMISIATRGGVPARGQICRQCVP